MGSFARVFEASKIAQMFMCVHKTRTEKFVMDLQSTPYRVYSTCRFNQCTGTCNICPYNLGTADAAVSSTPLVQHARGGGRHERPPIRNYRYALAVQVGVLTSHAQAFA